LGTKLCKNKAVYCTAFSSRFIGFPPNAGGNDRQPRRKRGSGRARAGGRGANPPFPLTPTNSPARGPAGIMGGPASSRCRVAGGHKKKKEGPPKGSTGATKGSGAWRRPPRPPRLGQKKPPSLLIRATKPARSKKLKLFFSGGFARSLSPLQCREKRDVSVKGS